MGNDLAVRLNVATGEYTQYLLPQDTNVRRVDVDSSTPLSSLWVGNNYAPQIVHIEPLTLPLHS